MTDDAQTEAPIAASPVAPAAQATAQGSALTDAASAPDTEPFLTTRYSDEYGADGRIVDITAGEASEHTGGDDPLLVKPTKDQLALR